MSLTRRPASELVHLLRRGEVSSRQVAQSFLDSATARDEQVGAFLHLDAQAVLAALFRRERTGKGRLIEMALYDCGVMVTGYYGLDAMLLGRDPARYGNAHPSIVPYGMFDAAGRQGLLSQANQRVCFESR